MPSTEMMIWAAISGAILLMLNMIKTLLKTGFDGLRDELSKIWIKLDTNNKETADLRSEFRAEIAAIKANCKASVYLHQRISDPDHK